MESNDEQFNNKFLRAFNKTSKKFIKYSQNQQRNKKNIISIVREVKKTMRESTNFFFKKG